MTVDRIKPNHYQNYQELNATGNGQQPVFHFIASAMKAEYIQAFLLQHAIPNKKTL